MTNPGMAYLVIIFLLFTLGNIILGTMIYLNRRKTRYQLLVSQTQGRFSEARVSLTKLTLDHKLSVDSLTFKYLYHLNTLFMRRPDQYQELSRALHYLSAKSNPDSETAKDILSQESKNWSNEVKEVAKMTGEALDYIIVDYSLPARLIYRFLKLLHPKLTPLGMLELMTKQRHLKMEKAKEIFPVVKESQNDLYNLAGVH